MEREQEIAKLVNVLRRTSRMALQAEWTGSAADTAAFCVDQYNRVLARLKELDGSNVVIFEPLPAGSSLPVAAMACRQLAAFYEDEVPRGGWEPRWSKDVPFFDPRPFKEFWEKSAREIEDFGEYIRESFDEWARQRKAKAEKTSGPETPKE
jgi:hypothetical protein